MHRLWMAAALSIVLIACGQNELDSETAGHVTDARADMSLYCLNGENYGRVLDGVDTLITVYRRDPEAVYPYDDEKPTMRQVLADAASTVDCDQRLSDRLDRALDAGA